VQGEANVQIDSMIHNMQKGETINIPLSAVHSVSNSNDVDLIFIETQLGSYFGEDDIVRINDKYGRK
jgi:mannose-6-phosphate isomerase-like protein (cupin superfamily)